MWGILDLLACFAPLSGATSTPPRLFWADFSGQSLVPGWMLDIWTRVDAICEPQGGDSEVGRLAAELG
jgi:hypothetical protein